MKNMIATVAICLLSFLSLTSKAECQIFCDEDGQCIAISYSHDPDDGTNHIISIEYCGGCAGGPWGCVLDRVTPTGSPAVPEANPGIYTNLTELVAHTPTQSELNSLSYTINHNTPTHSWVNPIGLTSNANSLIYGTTVMDIFYVHTSINIANGSPLLNLYSNRRSIF